VKNAHISASRWFTLVAACAITLVLLSGAPASATNRVSGTATYRERIALPPDAVLEVRLDDVSLADAPAIELGRIRVENPGNPPFAFEISYDPDQIDSRHVYAVRATIRAGGKLLFTTDTHYPVLTRGAGDEVELLLRRVGAGGGGQSAAALGPLPVVAWQHAVGSRRRDVSRGKRASKLKV